MRTVLLLLAVIACGGEPTAPGKVTSSDEASDPAEDLTAAPFSADQIRAAMPVGTTWVFRIETAGMPVEVSEWTVTAATEDSVTIRTVARNEAGEEVKPAIEETSDFEQLLSHARFPAAATVRREGSVDVPAGQFETISFEVSTSQGEMTSLRSFHFAKNKPGPPVLFTAQTNGREVFRMTSLKR